MNSDPCGCPDCTDHGKVVTYFGGLGPIVTYFDGLGPDGTQDDGIGHGVAVHEDGHVRAWWQWGSGASKRKLTHLADDDGLRPPDRGKRGAAILADLAPILGDQLGSPRQSGQPSSLSAAAVFADVETARAEGLPFADAVERVAAERGCSGTTIRRRYTVGRRVRDTNPDTNA